MSIDSQDRDTARRVVEQLLRGAFSEDAPAATAADAPYRALYAICYLQGRLGLDQELMRRMLGDLDELSGDLGVLRGRGE